MGRKGAADGCEMDGDVIAEVTQAIEDFVLRHKQPGEGIMIEARKHAPQWTVAGQPLFASSAHPLTLLLAANVVQLRQDHELLKCIRQHRSTELDKLISDSLDAEAHEFAPVSSNTEQMLTARQRSERRRSKSNRDVTKSIEYQFGGGLEGDDWRKFLSPLLGRSAYENMLRRSQSCLDDIFAGKSVTLLRLEELFWMDRHRFAKPLRRFRIRDYRAVASVMDFLLKEKPRTPRKKPGRGRPRALWLNDRARRLRVLKAIEERINGLHIDNKIATAFLKVIRRHLQDSGKK